MSSEVILLFTARDHTHSSTKSSAVHLLV